jgi:hypothetical protein
MEIDDDLDDREERRKSSTGNQTKRESSRMEETPIAHRPSNDDSKSLKEMLQRCESSAPRSPENRVQDEELDLTDDEDKQRPHFDAIDDAIGRSPVVDRCPNQQSRLVQTTIKFPAKKNLQKLKKAAEVIARPGTPDFVKQPKRRFPQPKEMPLIASDSEAETNEILPETAANIRNLTLSNQSLARPSPRKIAVAKERRTSVQPANSYIDLAPKNSNGDGFLQSRERSLCSTPNSEDEEEAVGVAVNQDLSSVQSSPVVEGEFLLIASAGKASLCIRIVNFFSPLFH